MRVKSPPNGRVKPNERQFGSSTESPLLSPKPRYDFGLRPYREMEFATMYIGKAAKLSGTTVKSIRHYEKIGLIPPPQRDGKYRVYSMESIDVLRFIKCAQQLGFKLKELQSILGNHKGHEFPWELAQQEIERKKLELTLQIDSLQKMLGGLLEFERTLKDAKEECHLLKARDHA